jgi:hypothetical protein
MRCGSGYSTPEARVTFFYEEYRVDSKIARSAAWVVVVVVVVVVVDQLWATSLCCSGTE